LISEAPVLARTESIIQYENLEELPNVPDEFNMERGYVVWEGSLESEYSGAHKFRLWSSGYFKIWIDGELKYDLWRQGWNPWFDRLLVDMKAGEKKSIKIEWIPDSGQAYVSVNWLSPLDAEEQQNISFYSEGGREIDYYFINGNSADEVISGYRLLTGKSPILPKWSFGYWQSRERYRNQDQLARCSKGIPQAQYSN
jgi:alpha-D-xyloside xylohydrolase